MSAKPTDLARIQEIYDVIVQTQRQLGALSFDKARFLHPGTDQDEVLAEGFMNRVLRVTEEVGRLDDELASSYGFNTAGASGVRNRLAHAYGDVDAEIIWAVIEREFDALLSSCRRYCDDVGVDLE